MIVLDTNVLSELMRLEPHPHVTEWMDAQTPASLFTTTVTQAEIMFGVCVLPEGKRRRDLDEAVSALFRQDLKDRILPFDSPAAAEFAEIAAHRRRGGAPISQFDAQIAAIARSRGAALATRNVSDFRECGVHVIDPWSP